jgi:imidazolonepropionase-like amidohydrolase
MKFATLNGAYAIGFHKEVGSLEAGKTAHCLVIDCNGMASGNPYEMILSTTYTPRWLI